jgi:hypothetical protein
MPKIFLGTTNIGRNVLSDDVKIHKILLEEIKNLINLILHKILQYSFYLY